MGHRLPKLRFTDEGDIDPDSIHSAGVNAVTEWIKLRYSHQDPLFPIDTKVDEDPEHLIVSLLRHWGLDEPASQTIASAHYQLLDKGFDAGNEPAPYIYPALRVCQKHTLPQLAGWFTEQLGKFSSQLEGTGLANHSNPQLVNEFFFAASVQARGIPKSRAAPIWEKFLEIPDLSTHALSALSSGFSGELQLLPTWWSATAGSQEQHQELREILLQGWRTLGPDGFQRALRAKYNEYPSELKTAIVHAANDADLSLDVDEDATQEREASIRELEATIREQKSTISKLEAAISKQKSTIREQKSTISKLESRY